jgi:chloramphenicol-sensitive protein RarD
MPPSSPRLDGRGLAAAAGAFSIWGLIPWYLKFLQVTPVLQIAAHRLTWGCIFALGWLAVRRELKHVWNALADARTLRLLATSAALIAINWVLYVWAVANERVVEASLGYFMNPLVNVVLGVMVLSERLNRMQWLSVAIAASGVAYLTWATGSAPWIALSLAVTFGLYGLVRKLVHAESLPGFATETLLLVPAGLGYLLWSEAQGSSAFGHATLSNDLLLILSGPITAIPLVLFSFGARRIPYSTVGLLQYIAPSLQLLIGVFVFHEPFARDRAIGFILIWAALAVYAADGVWRSRKSLLVKD